MIAVRSPAREQTRARDPDETGVIVRDGVQVAWERYGDGTPTILLMPTWSIIHSRHWKGQIPYLARHYRVVTFDGRGNGRSDRPTTQDAYGDSEFVADACAVMDASRTERAVAVGLSMGGGYALRLAAEHPDRVQGVVFEGAAVHLHEPDPSVRSDRAPSDRSLAEYVGWEKYDFDYWRWDYEDFAEFFFGQCYTEPHSTKQIEDAVGWAREIGPEALILSDLAPYLEGNGSSVSPGRTVALTRSLATRVRCPALVIHGGADAIIEVDRGRALAEALGARYIQLDGVGHIPSGRHPVWFNLVIREFVESLGGSVA